MADKKSAKHHWYICLALLLSFVLLAWLLAWLLSGLLSGLLYRRMVGPKEKHRHKEVGRFKCLGFHFDFCSQNARVRRQFHAHDWDVFAKNGRGHESCPTAESNAYCFRCCCPGCYSFDSVESTTDIQTRLHITEARRRVLV